MVSSQLDADRMDYLLRDAYFTGTSYGEFDLERVMEVLLMNSLFTESIVIGEKQSFIKNTLKENRRRN